MRAPQAEGWTRRRFLSGLALAGTTGFLGLRLHRVAAEPPPETTRLRLFKIPGICLAPQYVAEDLLRQDDRRVPADSHAQEQREPPVPTLVLDLHLAHRGFLFRRQGFC